MTVAAEARAAVRAEAKVPATEVVRAVAEARGRRRPEEMQAWASAVGASHSIRIEILIEIV